MRRNAGQKELYLVQLIRFFMKLFQFRLSVDVMEAKMEPQAFLRRTSS